MHFTLGQAAKEVKKSKSTISKYISNGKLSAISTSKNGYRIDPSELFRVFPQNETRTGEIERLRTPKMNSENSTLQKEVDMLREQLSDKDFRLTDKENVINDLRERLDNESAERRKLTMMITDNSQKPRGFWKRFLT